MQDFKSQRIKVVLKGLLKKKGMTYEDLAEVMDCSVPTIKRILGAEELSLNRLLHLCEILGTNLSEIEVLTQEPEGDRPSFTEEQDEFLAKNQNFFAYLMRLYSGMSPKQIAEEFKLTERSTDKYLLGLEKYDLIKVSGSRVRPAFKRNPTLGRGALARAYAESLVKAASYFFIELVREGLYSPKSEEEKNKTLFSIATVTVSRASYQAFVEEQQKAFRNFEKLAAFEEKTKAPSDLMTAVFVDAHTLVKKDYEGLRRLDNSLGEITNL